ncbi:S9 family peptidase [Pleionea sp. CnH1-48]|uniref:alpha/beta hydrolase family protein n=1 Tax=Pleionea sp. CnH1-48 TaxID=2954494 RepID=UPI002097DCA6|nr:prolyl oligopeptidase family serine peptidase [Pleionea sp. CnH1-48]MCO7224331.1 prolyl oligopeptidase family serine peptidase [Pleionea sp. CnH1-48]
MSNVKSLLTSLVVMFASVYAYAGAIPVVDLITDPDYSSFKLSPKSKLLAGQGFYENFHTIEIIQVGKEISNIAFKLHNNSNSKIENYLWLDDDTLLVDYVGQTGQELVLIIDVVTEPELNFHKRDLLFKGEILSVVKGSEEVIVKHLRYGSEDFDLYKLSLEDLASRSVPEEKKINHGEKARHFWLDSNNNVVMKATVNDENRSYYVSEDQDWIKFFELTGSDRFYPIQRLSDSKVAVLTNIERDKVELVEYDLLLQTFGETLFAHDRYDLEYASFWGDSDQLAFVTYYSQGRPVTRYFESYDSRLAKLLSKHFKGKTFHVLSEDESKKNFVVKVFNSDDPGYFYLVNPKRRVISRLAPSYSKLQAYDFSSTVGFSVTNSEGEDIEAFFTPPVDQKGAFPLLVVPHGGPIGVREFDTYDPDLQFYASRGYGVLRMNFSGSTGYGKDFMTSGVGQFGKKIEEDINTVVDYTLNKFQVDKSKVCIMGTSYGGYSALMSVVKYPQKYRCIVSAYGVSDIKLLFNQSNIHNSDEANEKIANIAGKEEELADHFHEISPVYHADKISVPVLFIVGNLDYVADLEHSYRMVYLLNRSGNSKVEYINYLRAKHGPENMASRINQLIITESFIRDALKHSFTNSELAKAELKQALLYLNARNVKERKNASTKRLKKMIGSQ